MCELTCGNDLPALSAGCETGWATGASAFGCSLGFGGFSIGAGVASAAATAGAGGASGNSRFFSSFFSGAASSFSFDGNACGSGIFSLSNAFCSGASVLTATAGTIGASVDETASCGSGFDAQITSKALNMQTWNDFILNIVIENKKRETINSNK